MHIAIDPGLTTGMVCGDTDFYNSRNTFSIALAREITWSDRFWLRQYIHYNRDIIDAIIIERFSLFPNPKTMNAQINSEFPSVRIIGLVEAYAEMYGLLNKIVYQNPSDRKSVTIPVEHQRCLPLNGRDHIKDAYRHLRFYYLTHQKE